jgi:hypothetical protein
MIVWGGLGNPSLTPVAPTIRPPTLGRPRPWRMPPSLATCTRRPGRVRR